MRVDNVTFDAFNRSTAKDVRYVVAVNFGDEASPAWEYFTSHPDAAVPDGASVIHGVIESVSGRGQRLDPLAARSEIGGVSIRLVDVNGDVNTVITGHRAAGRGLRHKEVVVYAGGEGLAWADYVTVETVIVDGHEVDGTRHTITCSDVQRAARRDIFNPRETNLRTSIGKDATVVPVYATAEFEFNTHGSSYSDAPGARVIYLELGDEIIRAEAKLDAPVTVTGTDIATGGNSITSQTTDLSVFDDGQQIVITGAGAADGAYTITGQPTATRIDLAEPIPATTAGASVNILADVQFYRCTRGVLNTKPADHEVDPSDDPDRRPQVREFIYIEMPLLKLLYAVLTGNVYGQADPFPSTWHLGMSTRWVATSTFLDHPDWWDPTDDGKGFIVRFEGLKKRDGKRFIEDQLLRLQGAFLRVQNDGQLALVRRVRVPVRANYDELIGDHNITQFSTIKEDIKAVRNVFAIHWNMDRKTGKPTRHLTLIDADSIATHGRAPAYEMTFEGLSGYTTTQAQLAMLRDSARDLYAGPPLRARVKCLPSLNVLEVGDVVRWRSQAIRDPVDGGPLDRSFMVVGTQVDWVTGEVVLDLLGTSQEASPINDADSATVLSDADYVRGTALQTYLDANYPGSYTLTNGVLHITAPVTLTGSSDLGTGGHYHHIGDVQIDAGVTVTITDNVALWVAGHFTVNGVIDGAGKGPAGGTPGLGTADGVAGFIGTTRPAGGVYVREYVGGRTHLSSTTPAQEKIINPLPTTNRGGVTIRGRRSAAPAIGIDPTDVLSALPKDLRGSSGSAGGGVSSYEGASSQDRGKGGAGGAGGAGLVIVCRSITTGVSARIDLSGADGATGDQYVTGSGAKAIGGTGAGGAPGACYVLLDGRDAIETGLRQAFRANTGASPLVGERLPGAGRFVQVGTTEASQIWRSYYEPYQAEDHGLANLRIQYIPPNTAPSPDVPDLAERPMAIHVQEQVSTKNGLNQSALEISVTPPTGDPAYHHAIIKVARAGTSSWVTLGEAFGTQELVHVVPADGGSWIIRAHAVSRAGKVSPDYVETTYTVTSAAGTAVIAPGNRIATSETVGQSTNGAGIIVDTVSLSGYDAVGTKKVEIDAATGKLTAIDVELSGTITATAGTIGGWTATAGSLSSGGLTLDAANQRIRAASGGNYTEMSPSGFKAWDTTLGQTVNIPTDGSQPWFYRGRLKEMEYEIYTSGVIKTDTDPATNGGVLINPAGVQVFDANGNRTAFLDAINSAHEFKGTVDMGNGSLIVGTPATTVKQQAADGAAAWSKFSGVGNTLPAGEVEFAFAGSSTKGGNALNTDAVGSFAASDVEASVLNYNTRNDRNSKPLTAPVVTSGAITHTLNTDGSANVSFQWGYAGIEDDIDGFIIYAYRAGAAGTRTIDGTEPAYYVTPRHRAFTLEGVPADAYYQFGVRSYRIVDPDIAPGGALLSSIVQDGTTLYQPATNVAFQGVVGGATYSDGTPIDDLQPREAGADNTGNRIYGTGGLLPNWNLDIIDGEGKPAGIQPVESVSDRTGIAATANGLKIQHPSDNYVAYGFPAIPIDDKQRYRVVITHRSGQSTTTGLYLRFNELGAALNQGKTHVGTDTGGPTVQFRTGWKDLLANGPMPGPTWVTDEYIYTPTPGTKFASFSMYHWGNAVSFEYEVDRVQIIPIAKTASDIDYSDGTNVDALKPRDPAATAGATWDDDISNQPSDQLIRNNQMDLSVWAEADPLSGSIYVPDGSIWGLNGVAGENRIIKAVGPHGTTELVWEGVASGDRNADGGWNYFHKSNNAAYSIRKDVAYRFSVWIKRLDTQDGSSYLGTTPSWGNGDGAAAVTNTAGTDNGNPYFWSGDLPELNKWYLVVGYLHPVGYTGGLTGLSGVWDPETGKRVLAGNDFVMKSNIARLMHRAYYYYSSTAGARQQFARPRIDIVDGSEPSIIELLGAADNTRGAIESVVTINDQGAIQNTSWDAGTKKIKIDFANQLIGIGDDLWGSSNPHILSDYNSGAPRFYAGNGADQFIKYENGKTIFGGTIEAAKFDSTNVRVKSVTNNTYGPISTFTYATELFSGGGSSGSEFFLFRIQLPGSTETTKRKISTIDFGYLLFNGLLSFKNSAWTTYYRTNDPVNGVSAWAQVPDSPTIYMTWPENEVRIFPWSFAVNLFDVGGIAAPEYYWIEFKLQRVAVGSGSAGPTMNSYRIYVRYDNF